MSTDKTEATRLADALTSVVQTYPQMSEDEPGGYCSEVDQIMDEAAALLRRWPDGEPAAPAPDGWVMVPKEPTVEMVRAIVNTIPQGPYDFAAISVYRAMIAASPAAPAQPAAPVVPMQTSDLWRKGMAEKMAQASEIDKALSAAPVVREPECVTCQRCGFDNWIQEGESPGETTARMGKRAHGIGTTGGNHG